MLDKQQILERILGMFMRYGIKSMTMDDIARELGISKKTLYQDFKDKRSLISEVIEFDLLLNKQLRDQVLLPRLGAIEEFHLINSRIHFIRSRYSETFHWDLKRYFPDTYQTWVSNRRRSVYKLITDNLKKGKKEGVYRREIKEQVVGNLYVIIIETLESSDLLDDHESLSGDFIKEMFYYHLHGICNQSGLIELSRWSSENRNTQAFKI